MSAEAVVRVLVGLVEIYLLAGALFALLFVVFWVGRLDVSAKGASPGFRLVIIPGVTLLWPLLLRRLIRKQQQPVECSAHRLCAARFAHLKTTQDVGS